MLNFYLFFYVKYYWKKEVVRMIKERLHKFVQTDGFIIIIGTIAGLLLLSNLLFSSYTLLKQNMVVQRDVERIEKIEDRLVQLEKYHKEQKMTQEVE